MLTCVCGGKNQQPQEVAPRPLPEWARSAWSVRGQLFRLSRALWELGATPGILVRGLGPWGPQLIQKYARNRCALPARGFCCSRLSVHRPSARHRGSSHCSCGAT